VVDPAWVISDQTPETPELGENADLCTGHPTRIDGYLVTRNWSNVAARAGERPCVPAPPGPMFGAFADPIAVKDGGTATAKVTYYATGPMPAFRVAAFAADPKLHATLDVTTGNDGDLATLTVKADPSWVEIPGQNVVFLYATTKDYSTRRAVIVHAE
jgi:hypothetical protein